MFTNKDDKIIAVCINIDVIDTINSKTICYFMFIYYLTTVNIQKRR